MSVSQPRGATQRDKQRRETHERIYESALAEFRRVGFANAQIDRIASAAGVVRGTFYFHFPSKEHVLLELQERTQARLLESIHQVDPAGTNLDAVMEALVRGLSDSGALVDDAGLMRDMVALYVRQPLDDAFAEQPTPVIDALAKLLVNVARRGELREGVDPERAALLILTSAFGHFAGVRPETDTETELRELMDVLSRGLRA